MQKLYHSISEVSGLVDEEQHILRYWEKEFDQLKPKKNRGGNRIYSDKDLAMIRLIKQYLRIEKLSLKGAKERLSRFLTEGQDSNLFSRIDGPGIDKTGGDRIMPGKDMVYINRSELDELYDSLLSTSKILK